MNHITPLKRPARLQLAALTVAAAFSCSALLTSANAATYTWNGFTNNYYGEWGSETDKGAWGFVDSVPPDPPVPIVPVSAADTIIKYFADNSIQLDNGYTVESYPKEDFTLNKLELNGKVGTTGTGDLGAAWLTLGQQGMGNFNFAGTAPTINLNAAKGVNYILANKVTLTANLAIGLTQPVPATSPFNAADGAGSLDFAEGISGADFRLDLKGVETKSSVDVAPGILETVSSRLVTLSGDTQLKELYIGAQTLAGTVAVKNGAALTVGTDGTGNLWVSQSSADSTRNGIYGVLDLRDAGTVDIHVDMVGVVSHKGGITLPYMYGKLTLGQDTTIRAKSAVRVGYIEKSGPSPMVVSRGDGAFFEVMDGGVATIMTDLFLVGYGKAIGEASLGAGATLTLAGYTDGAMDTTKRALLSIGRATQSTAGALSGSVDFSAGTFIGYLSGIEMAMSVFAGTGDGTLTGELILGSSNANFLSVIGTSVMEGKTDTGRNAVVTISQARSVATSLVGARDSQATGTLTLGYLAAGSIIESLDNGTAILVAERTSTGAGNATGTLNLDGGELTIKTTGVAISGGFDPGNVPGNTSKATSTVNFNGTQLIVGANSANWIQGLTTANVAAGGVKINTNGFTIGISQVFSGTGDFTKSGTGTLTLSGVSTFTGAMNVLEGTLEISGSGSLAGAVSVNVAANAVLKLDSTTSLNGTIVLNLTNGAELYIATGMETIGALKIDGIDLGVGTFTAEYLNANYGITVHGGAGASLQVIPEPTTYGLLGAIGLAGLVVLRRRRK